MVSSGASLGASYLALLSFGCFWGAFGVPCCFFWAVLRPCSCFWGAFGVACGFFWAVSGSSWACLRPSLVHLGFSWAHLGCSPAHLEGLLASLWRLLSLLAGLWGLVGISWGHLGFILGHPGRILGAFSHRMLSLRVWYPLWMDPFLLWRFFDSSNSFALIASSAMWLPELHGLWRRLLREISASERDMCFCER